MPEKLARYALVRSSDLTGWSIGHQQIMNICVHILINLTVHTTLLRTVCFLSTRLVRNERNNRVRCMDFFPHLNASKLFMPRWINVNFCVGCCPKMHVTSTKFHHSRFCELWVRTTGQPDTHRRSQTCSHDALRKFKFARTHARRIFRRKFEWTVKLLKIGSN